MGSLSESGASSGEDVLTSWWLWTIVGVVVVGAGVPGAERGAPLPGGLPAAGVCGEVWEGVRVIRAMVLHEH